MVPTKRCKHTGHNKKGDTWFDPWAEQLVEVPTVSCLFPLCSSSLPSRTWTFQFLALVVIMEVFKVFSQDKVRCSALLSRSSTFLLVEVFKIFSLILVWQLLPQFRVKTLGQGFFSHFSPVEKVRGVRVRGCTRTRPHPRGRLMRSPWIQSGGCNSVTSPRTRPTYGTGVLVCPPGAHGGASRSSGSELRMGGSPPLLAQIYSCQYV